MKNFRTLPILAVALAVLYFVFCALAGDAVSLSDGLPFIALGAIGFLMKDANLKKTKALPNGAATTTSDGIDLENSPKGDFLANCSFKISAPALTTTELGDTQTIKYTLEHDTDSAFGSVATVPGFADVITQTGAGGAGAVANTFTARLPVDVKRYIRLKQVKAGASNASTSSGTLELLL